jgi:hypothetical protein
MLSVIIYGLIILVLVFWVEGSTLNLSNSLIIKKNAGEELEDWLKKFHWGNRNEISEKRELPRYKFYSEIIEGLLSMARKMGGNYQDSFLFLREGLKFDRQFEKKLKETTLGLWLQMLMMMGLTWAFIFGALTIVEIEVATLKLLMIISWQLLGLGTLPLLLRYLRQKLFGDIGVLWKMLYVLTSLARVPLSRSEIFQMAQVQKLESIKQKNLLHLAEKLKEICHKALKQGGSYEEEVKYLMEELRFQEKWYFELFEKRLVAIKLMLLSVFFLPSYLAFIFLLLGDLMKLM